MKVLTPFAGLVYVPRPAPNLNGNIGQYEISVSATGVNWGAPIATGVFADDSAPKTVTFAPVVARFVRLTALTEAGGRVQYTAAAEVSVVTSGARPDGTKGTWSSTVGFPVIPVAAANLPDGRVLVWSAYLSNDYGMNAGYTQTAIFDPATMQVTQRTISETQHDMFCPGHRRCCRDGRLLVTGGSDERPDQHLRPAVPTSWTSGPPMNIPRGYQGEHHARRRRVFTLGGSWSGGTGGKNGELWSPGLGWRSSPASRRTPIITADPRPLPRRTTTCWLFTWTNGRVFHAGPSKQMNWISHCRRRLDHAGRQRGVTTPTP